MVNQKERFEVMALTPQQRLLLQLSEAGLHYALIREPSEWANSGDIDVLVKDVDASDLLLKKCGFLVFSADAYNIKYLKFDPDSGLWIHLDVVSTVCFGDLASPGSFIDSLLISSEIGSDGVRRLSSYDRAILYIFHAALNKKSLSPKSMEMILLPGLERLVERESLYSFLPKPLGEYLQIIRAVQSGVLSCEKAVMEIQSSFLPVEEKLSLFSRATRRFRKLMRGNQAVVFLGPDGAGKSTITESLVGLRWPKVRRQFMGPARESEMREVFAVMLRYFDMWRNRRSKKTLIGKVARAGWQLICYVDFIDRLYRHLWFWGSGGVVIFDRYACDMYFRKPTRLNELFFLRLFPKPRFVFLCVGNAEAIHRRKPELAVGEIESTIDRYRVKLAQYGISYAEINTTSNAPTENIDHVLSRLIENDWFNR